MLFYPPPLRHENFRPPVPHVRGASQQLNSTKSQITGETHFPTHIGLGSAVGALLGVDHRPLYQPGPDTHTHRR